MGIRPKEIAALIAVLVFIGGLVGYGVISLSANPEESGDYEGSQSYEAMGERFLLGSRDVVSSEEAMAIGSPNEALDWMGEMRATVKEAAVFSDIDLAMSAYSDLALRPNAEGSKGAVMICRVELENVNATSFDSEHPERFNLGLMRIISVDAGAAPNDEIGGTFGRAILFNGTSSEADYKGYFEFDLPQGKTREFIMGFYIGAEPPEDASLILAIGSDGNAPPAALVRLGWDERMGE